MGAFKVAPANQALKLESEVISSPVLAEKIDLLDTSLLDFLNKIGPCLDGSQMRIDDVDGQTNKVHFAYPVCLYLNPCFQCLKQLLRFALVYQFELWVLWNHPHSVIAVVLQD